MSNVDDTHIKVVGEQRQHPAVRLVARACIEIARQIPTPETAQQETEFPEPLSGGSTTANTGGSRPEVNCG
jgi:hypothetical protein